MEFMCKNEYVYLYKYAYLCSDIYVSLSSVSLYLKTTVLFTYWYNQYLFSTSVY